MANNNIKTAQNLLSSCSIETTPNVYKLKKQIYAEYKGVRLRDFLINQWLPKIKNTKNFTPNSFYVLKDKYTSQCVQFVSNK